MCLEGLHSMGAADTATGSDFVTSFHLGWSAAAVDRLACTPSPACPVRCDVGRGAGCSRMGLCRGQRPRGKRCQPSTPAAGKRHETLIYKELQTARQATVAAPRAPVRAAVGGRRHAPSSAGAKGTVWLGRRTGVGRRGVRAETEQIKSKESAANAALRDCVKIERTN